MFLLEGETGKSLQRKNRAKSGVVDGHNVVRRQQLAVSGNFCFLEHNCWVPGGLHDVAVDCSISVAPEITVAPVGVHHQWGGRTF